tara:strand:- start:477 stop:623 length:147 start_codon:yes stop_codon:yes gene_type:complete
MCGDHVQCRTEEGQPAGLKKLPYSIALMLAAIAALYEAVIFLSFAGLG